MEKTAVVMTGLPCSGKSTISSLIMTALDQSYSIVSTDNFIESFMKHVTTYTNDTDFVVNYTDMFNDGWYDVGIKGMFKHLELASKNDHNLIWDQVNNKKKKRKDTVKKLRALGYTKIVSCYVNTPFDVCLKRNENRQYMTGKFIPVSEMERMHNGLTQPEMDEGFDSLYVLDNYNVSCPSEVVQDLIKELREV